ncbi:MAG: PHP domain-containing protein [Oscillospiraceae bacterium]|nr:PHP domain-containing protein [Oscillospiraceae bacterium]
MIGDLHCHTRMSDGSLGIEELITYAKRAGMDFIAITDHDTMAAVDRAAVLGKRHGVHVIPGVEFSCREHKSGYKAHIICYLPRFQGRLEGACSKMLGERIRAGNQELQNVMKLYPVTTELVSKYSSHSRAIYRQHIMHALMELGYTDKIFGELYEDILGKNGRCRVEKQYLELHDITELIHQAGGICCLAHPTQYAPIDLAVQLAESGEIDALEVDSRNNKPETMDELAQLAKQYKLIRTGGSDFHGFYTSRPEPIGTCITKTEGITALFAAANNLRRE